TDPTTTTAPATLPGRARDTREGPGPSREGSRPYYEQPYPRPRPILESEPRRTQGLEVTALAYQSDPHSTRLDLPLVPPRQRPGQTHQRDRPKPRRRMNAASPYQ